MKRYGITWNKKRVPDGYGDIYIEGWYTDISVGWFPYWRFCIAKYDGAPYFLFICGVIMFRFGKYWHWD